MHAYGNVGHGFTHPHASSLQIDGVAYNELAGRTPTARGAHEMIVGERQRARSAPRLRSRNRQLE